MVDVIVLLLMILDWCQSLLQYAKNACNYACDYACNYAYNYDKVFGIRMQDD